MGLGPPIIALYQQMKMMGAFENVRDVIELGAQAVWCPKRQLVRSLFEAFDRPAPPEDMLDRFANWKGSGRELYEALGFSYRCVDVEPSFESVPLDLNFDGVPQEQLGKYDFVTNHGTTEHILNQYNCFKVMHDFCRPGGMLLHALPFTVHLEHGFFNYQPNLFSALARYNSYETLGVWVGPDWQLASLIPWEQGLMDYLVLNAKTTHLLVVLQRKRYDKPFCVPFQEIYEESIREDAYKRYTMVVDGETLDGKRVRYLTGIAKQAAQASPVQGSPVEASPAAPNLSFVLGKDLLAEVRKRIARRLLKPFQ